MMSYKQETNYLTRLQRAI